MTTPYIKNIAYLFWILSITFFFRATTCQALETLDNGWMVNDIVTDDGKTFSLKGGDPYIIFPILDQPVCGLSGVKFSLEFSPIIIKPFYLELFWKPVSGGFSEENKVFFILHPSKTSRLEFVVPIERDVNYDQIRLDLPRDLEASFIIENNGIVSLQDEAVSETVVDAYSILSMKDAKELDILIPYIIKTLKHGALRFKKDVPFVVFWLLFIVCILFGTRLAQRKMEELQ